MLGAQDNISLFFQLLICFLEGTQDAFLNCEGSGLYLRQSAANHSCMPNAETSFPYNNSVLRFTAKEDIAAGQVSFTYSSSAYN